MLNATDPLDAADELIIILAKVIVISIAAVYYNELAGLLILLGVALAMLRTGRPASSPDSQP
ncbi:MAG: hypothetical protein O7F73_18075 [Gammaproteobacteria bacterium]|nr:hypothetical protein [Gammaproteobacteria bacterium]